MRRFCYGIFVHLSWSNDDLFCVTCSSMYTSRDYDGWKPDGVNIILTSVGAPVKYSTLLRNGNIYWEEKRERWGDETCTKDLGSKHHSTMMKTMTQKSHHTIINNNHDSTCNFFFKRSSIVSVFPFFQNLFERHCSWHIIK